MATGDETIVQTHKIDNRKSVTYPVWQIKSLSTWDADDTGSLSLSVPINGTIKSIVFKISNATNAITGQLEILDDDSNVIYDSTEQARNATYTADITECVAGTIKIRTTISGAAGSGGITITVWLRGV